MGEVSPGPLVFVVIAKDKATCVLADQTIIFDVVRQDHMIPYFYAEP